MTSDSRTMSPSPGWDRYWRESGDGAAYSSQGAEHPLLASFWREVFAAHRGRAPSRILDIACGNGSLEQAFFDAAAPAEVVFLGFDLSAAAVAAVARRFPPACAFVANARAVPLPSASCSLVVSQFGVEYAGDAALVEALRLVAPGGTLALLLHHRDGSIFRDCAANLDAVESLRRAEFAAHAAEAFGSRTSGPGPATSPTARMAPALRALEAVLEKHGQHVAAGAVIRFYNDVARLLREPPAPGSGGPTVDWLRRMDAEFAAYAQRMASMCAAALSGEAFHALCHEIGRAGLKLARADTFGPPARLPLAWAVVAARQPA